MLIPCDEVNILNTFRVMIILRLLLLLTNLHLKLLSTQGTGPDKLLSTQRVKQTKIEINLSNISLKRVSFPKFLGVIIDEKLSFTRHISFKNKISKAMGIIIKARKYLNRKSLLNLYHAFVFPYLTYCIEIWGNASDIHLDDLLKVKKKLFESL